MLKLDSEINIDLGEFFHWWRSEIKDLIPEKFRSIFIRNRQFLIASPGDDYFRLTHWVDGKEYDLGAIEAGGIGKASYDELIEKKPDLSKFDLILRLPGQDAVIKKISLPEAAKENLQKVVLYELDKLTPFKPEQVYYSLVDVDKTNAPGFIVANLIVVPREKLDFYYKVLKEWGISPVIADYKKNPNRFNRPAEFYNLLPESLKIKKNYLPDFIVGGLALLTIIMVSMIFIVPVWMEHQTTELLRDQISLVEKEARKVDDLKIEIDNLYTVTRQLIERKKTTPSIVEIVNTVSRIITDDTWLTFMQYSGENLQMQGQSTAASSLIGALEASELFDNVRFTSPVTQDRRSGLERFHITAHITQGSADEQGS